MHADSVDREIVKDGLPTDPGWYYLWHHNSGWPVLSVLQVQVEDGRAYYFIGTAGTDDKHPHEVWRMVRAPWNGTLGYSDVSPQAFEYFKAEHERTRTEVLALLAARKGD